MSDYPKITLKPGRERPALNGHPWIFSGALQCAPDDLSEGSIVEVFTAGGKLIGTGHFGTRTIAVKLFSYEPIKDELAFWISALSKALELRRRLGILDNPNTSAFRLVHGEGDNLPGLIIDIYNQTAVLQCQSLGMFHWRETICRALKEVLGDKLGAIFDKSPAAIGTPAGKAVEQIAAGSGTGGYLYGQAGSPVIKEHGLSFICDWERGQKTGFYLDQRENRLLLKRYARGRTVLNAFCYTGAFSVYAASGGAETVCSVDSSKIAVESAAQNLELNNIKIPHQGVVADCFEYLATIEPAYDLIILDPPAFVKHQKALAKGLRGYESINFAALNKIAPGGLLFTFSCSELVSREEFRQRVANAAVRAKRRVQILHELSQAPCHPINLFHPEGAYLKGLVLAVE